MDQLPVQRIDDLQNTLRLLSYSLEKSSSASVIQSCGSLLRYVCNEFTFVEDKRVEELDICLALLKALWSY